MSVALSPQNPINARLNPLVTYYPPSMATSNVRWSRVWAVAAVVTAVAFIALASFAFAYTTVFLESQLPLVSILIFGMGMPASFKVFSYMWEKSRAYADDALADREMMSNMETVGVSDSLESFRIEPFVKNADLLPILARYEYCYNKSIELLKTKGKLLRAPIEINGKNRGPGSNPRQDDVKNVDFSDPTQVAYFNARQLHRARIEGLYYQAARIRLHAAYLLLLMQNPHELRSENSFIQYTEASLSQRLIAGLYKDKSASVIAKTKMGTYTAQEVLAKDICELAVEIFGVVRKPEPVKETSGRRFYFF